MKGGPFGSVHEFHEFFARMYRMHWPNYDPHAPLPDAEYRDKLPDDAPITFTHSDLHPSNIMVSSEEDDGPARIVAIIDWHQSGWYPSYWEYCKLDWCTAPEDDWRATYVPQILTPEVDAYDGFNWFTLSMGI